MVITISRDQVMNLADKKSVAKTLVTAVKLLLKKKLYTPAFCLIAVGIDALSDGKKTKYIETLQLHFPELCLLLGAGVFYAKYRNGMLHEYQPKAGYALTEDREVGDKAGATLRIKGKKADLTGLNVEHLSRRFLAYAKTF